MAVAEAILAGIGQKLVVSVLSGAAAAIALTLLLRFASLKHAQLMEILYIMARTGRSRVQCEQGDRVLTSTFWGMDGDLVYEAVGSLNWLTWISSEALGVCGS